MPQTNQPAAHTPAKGSDTWHHLIDHLGKVAEKANSYAAKFDAGELGYYAGLWHDLGKYNPEFQKYLEDCHVASKVGKDAPRIKTPHSIQGARLAADKKCMLLALIIYGHHSGLPKIADMISSLQSPNLQKSYQKVLQQAPENLCQIPIEINLQKMISGQLKDVHRDEFFARILFSCLIDADHLDTEAHFDPEKSALRGSSITISELWNLLQKTQKEVIDKADNSLVNQIRADVYRDCVNAAELSPGIFRLAVPTGGGKTLSGMAFALCHGIEHNLDRVIVAIPYTSIIEQTVNVYRSIFGKDAVLEHHSAARESDSEDARREFAQARLATQNWDAPLIVTTTVQLFESLFANRPGRCRKLHNITRSVIILDEVQTLPLFLLVPILSVLRELVERYQVTLVLCTATQPALEGQNPYLDGFVTGSIRDIITIAKEKEHFALLTRVSYRIPQESWSWDRLAEDVSQHNRSLVILNTRKDALAVLDRLESSEHILHLSTLLCGKHRREVLEEVRSHLRNKQPCILVSTQVVEAGVDLDFPNVYRAIAPLDRIIQAAGRCNREGKREIKGQVTIFDPNEGSTPKGEYKTAIAITKILLNNPDIDLNNPEIFERYFQELYKNVNKDRYGIQELRKNLDYPKVAEEFKFINNDTTPVVIQYDEFIRDLLNQIERRGLFSGDWRSLQPYLVNLRNDYEFKQTEEFRRECAPNLWVWHGSYDSIRGIGIGDRAIAYDPADLIQ